MNTIELNSLEAGYLFGLLTTLTAMGMIMPLNENIVKSLLSKLEEIRKGQGE